MVQTVPLFPDMLLQYLPRYQEILGDNKLANTHADQIQALLVRGGVYARSDGLKKEGIGAHAYGFTSGKEEDIVWDGVAITPVNVEILASLRAELGVVIGILLVLYALQVQRCVSLLPVTIWINNAEVLERVR